MARNQKDNFGEQVKRDLRERVAHHCSNPGCRAATAAPGRGNDGVLRDGDAAHIEAASPKGPRYNDGMTSEQRSSIDNGIWLCQRCARLIDQDPDRYTVALMRSWKQQAEETATRELGRAPLSEANVQQQMVSALVGTPSLQTALLQNAHTAVKTGLESLDSRITVSTRYGDSGPEITLHAKETVALTFRIEAGKDDDIAPRLDAFLEQGEALSISARSVTIQGSRAVEAAFEPVRNNPSGQLRFQPPKRKAKMRICLLHPDGTDRLQLDDVDGYLQNGSKELTFHGVACGGMVRLKCGTRIQNLATASFTFEVDINSWVGLDIATLPYFDDVSQFVDRLFRGWLVEFELKIGGRKLFAGRDPSGSMKVHMRSMQAFLAYTRSAQRLAEILGRRITFHLTTVEREDHLQLDAFIKYGAPGDVRGKDSLASPLTSMLEVEDSGQNIRTILEKTKPAELKYVEQETQTLLVFGEPIALPRRIFTFSAVLPHIEADLSQVADGESVLVEWRPADNFKWWYDFDPGDAVIGSTG